jgi:hypothetical protein
MTHGSPSKRVRAAERDDEAAEWASFHRASMHRSATPLSSLLPRPANPTLERIKLSERSQSVCSPPARKIAPLPIRPQPVASSRSPNPPSTLPSRPKSGTPTSKTVFSPNTSSYSRLVPIHSGATTPANNSVASTRPRKAMSSSSSVVTRTVLHTEWLAPPAPRLEQTRLSILDLHTRFDIQLSSATIEEFLALNKRDFLAATLPTWNVAKLHSLCDKVADMLMLDPAFNINQANRWPHQSFKNTLSVCCSSSSSCLYLRTFPVVCS